jgi:hypothetical protein
MKHLRLKIYLLFNDVPDQTDEFVRRYKVADRILADSPIGVLPGDAERAWLKEQRDKAIAEFTLIAAIVAMLAAVIAAFRC